MCRRPVSRYLLCTVRVLVDEARCHGGADCCGIFGVPEKQVGFVAALLQPTACNWLRGPVSRRSELSSPVPEQASFLDELKDMISDGEGDAAKANTNCNGV